jgi:septal ring factor EnvC (AmiA/AmiB activator)
MAMKIDVAPGELIDKLTILEIKAANISDPGKLRNVRHEYEVLSRALDGEIEQTAELAELRAELKAINETLWRIEDDIRDCERAKDFGAAFIELARSVYHTNDRRAAVKRRINELLDSDIVEEKSYAAY